MSTKKLYKKEVYLKECSAKVTRTESGTLIFDRTVFFPEGGGQPCDSGTVDGFQVTSVTEKDGEVFHVVAAPEGTFQVGQTVVLHLDWEFRFCSMQRHCGEHILSGIFFAQLGAINRGFHMGNEYMTIDMDLPQITWEQAMEAELAANRVIWSDAPTVIRTFDSREEAEALPLRKPLALDEDITIVCVGDISNPADCVACCGTHPSTAGQVGLIKILKLESYKGMTRVYFKAGFEAYEDSFQKHEIVTELCRKYSSGTEDLMEKIKIQEGKNGIARKKLHDLKKILLEKDAREISTTVSNFASNSILHRFDYDYYDLDDLQSLGRQVIAEASGLLLLISLKEHTIMLFSNGHPDCGKLVRDNAEIYQGKGGGNPTSARVIFSKNEYVDTFIDLLDKHLR